MITRSATKPGSTCSTRREAREQQARAEQQHEGEGHLGHDQRAAQRARGAAPRSSRGPPGAGRCSGSCGSGARERHEAHHDPDREREDERVERRGRVEPDLAPVGQVLEVEGRGGAQRGGARPAGPALEAAPVSSTFSTTSCRASCQRRRAEGEPRRQLLGARAGADERQVRDVDAPDQQHEEGAAPQQVEDRLHVPDQVVRQADDDGAEAGVDQQLLVLREALEVRRVQGVDLGLGLLAASRPASAGRRSSSCCCGACRPTAPRA